SRLVHTEIRTYPRVESRPDPGHGADVPRIVERTIACTMIEDPTRQDGADSGQCIELLERGAIEVDGRRSARGAGFRRGCRGSRVGRAAGRAELSPGTPCPHPASVTGSLDGRRPGDPPVRVPLPQVVAGSERQQER